MVRVLKELVIFPSHSSTCQIAFEFFVLPPLRVGGIGDALVLIYQSSSESAKIGSKSRREVKNTEDQNTEHRDVDSVAEHKRVLHFLSFSNFPEKISLFLRNLVLRKSYSSFSPSMASATNANGSTDASTSRKALLTKIGGENYSAWAHAVRKALLTKNKLGFIDGTLTLSSPLVSTPSNVQAWIRCDNMVGTWLTNSVSPKLQASIIYEDTTLEIWNDLKNRFAQTNGPRVFNLQKDIAELHQGEMSITDFFTQLKVFWDQLQNLSPFPSCTCGQCICNINKRLTDLQVRESVMKFLMGLNDSFSQVRSQVLLMDPIPSLSKVYSLLIQEKTQRSVPNTSFAKVDSTALAAKLSNEHLGSFLGNAGKGKGRPTCTHYGKTGHTMEKCYKKHGFPPGFKFKNKPFMAHQVSSDASPIAASPMHHQTAFTPEQYQQLFALFGASASSIIPSAPVKEASIANITSSSTLASAPMSGIDLSHSVFSAQVVNRRVYDKWTWVLDTGATDHFVCSVDLLTSITATIQSLVHLPNGESAQVTHIGTVVLSPSLTLTNVLCVPSFSFNLLSVSTLTLSQPYCLVFLSTYCFIQDLLPWKTIGMGKAVDGLYLLQCDSLQHIPHSSLAHYLSNHKFNASFLPFSATTTASSASSFLWHARLGHPSDMKLKVLGSNIPSLHSILLDVVFHESIFPYVHSSNDSIPFTSLPLPCVSPVSHLHDDPLLSKTPTLTPHSIIQVHHTIDDDLLDEVPETSLDPIAAPVPLRRSTRSVTRPSYLQDFHCNYATSVQPLSSSQLGTAHPLSSHVSYHHLSPSYKAYCCAISSLVEPQFYHQAVSDPQWQATMAAEIAALEANNTWTLAPLPAGKSSIGCK
ncbi:uncharacterized protein LOC115966477 [Quercus lobata]|uniref:uncharacterized protein LOC115966477 n=1 Tax=Quercus lobata TaxID=97700 RepID=UPI0012456B6B|nr:uncharacterized protein LOC115966477 [Quercus lobata]